MDRSSNIVGIGVDCIEISRFTAKILNNKKFISRIFTKKEQEYCFNKPKPSQHFAVRWAAKEAVLKALPKKYKSLFYNSIEIINKKEGKPKIFIKNNLNCDYNFFVSLTHSKRFAIAFVLITQ